MIRVESEETQDYVREEKGSEFEEKEERTFTPSAVSVPLKPLFRCGKHCSEKTLSHWQLASVVMNEGDMKHTRLTCVRRVSMNAYRQKEKTAVECAVETGSGKEGVSWKNVENDGERTISALDVGAFLL